MKENGRIRVGMANPTARVRRFAWELLVVVGGGWSVWVCAPERCPHRRSQRFQAAKLPAGAHRRWYGL